MTIKKLSIYMPVGSMGNFAAWRHRNGYWRWALYFDATQRGLGFHRARSANGGGGKPGTYYPHFGCDITLPFGTIRLATQPPW